MSCVNEGLYAGARSYGKGPYRAVVSESIPDHTYDRTIWTCRHRHPAIDDALTCAKKRLRGMKRETTADLQSQSYALGMKEGEKRERIRPELIRLLDAVWSIANAIEDSDSPPDVELRDAYHDYMETPLTLPSRGAPSDELRG